MVFSFFTGVGMNLSPLDIKLTWLSVNTESERFPMYFSLVSLCSRMSMEFYSRYSHPPPGCVCSLFLHNVLTYLYMRMRNVMYNRC